MGLETFFTGVLEFNKEVDRLASSWRFLTVQ